MNILHLCPSLYDFWTTYEGEYLNESLLSRKDVNLKIWGKNRIGYVPGLTSSMIVKRLYGNDYPDVIIVHASLQKLKDSEDTVFFKDLQKLRSKSIIVWKIADCFKKNLPFYVNQINTYQPHIALVWYAGHIEDLKNRCKFTPRYCLFPHSVGRRYINKNLIRKFDLSLIGRCENGTGYKVTNRNFSGLKIYTPPHRENRAEKGASLISDLNKCRFSWNSPVKDRFVCLRFFEAPACGCISMVPFKFKDLDQLYPPDTYFVCNRSLKKASSIITKISDDNYIEMQNKAYKITISNHTMDVRVRFLLDFIHGRNVKVEEYYGM